jgi:hypothetical protein
VTRKFITKEGQRWDTIAASVYGLNKPYAYEQLIRANPQYKNIIVFSGGEILTIPNDETTEINDGNLPPWRRS